MSSYRSAFTVSRPKNRPAAKEPRMKLQARGQHEKEDPKVGDGAEHAIFRELRKDGEGPDIVRHEEPEADTREELAEKRWLPQAFRHLPERSCDDEQHQKDVEQFHFYRDLSAARELRPDPMRAVSTFLRRAAP
jgi:hypothetical protein